LLLLLLTTALPVEAQQCLLRWRSGKDGRSPCLFLFCLILLFKYSGDIR
jgi:hypothetical protein